MKVHITGGGGFIGQGIYQGLRHQHDVSFSDVADVNVTARSSLEAHFGKLKPDAIIHLAGLMGAQGSKKDLFEYFSVNSVGVLNTLDAALRSGVKHFIFLSSLTVYGKNDPPLMAVNEDSRFNPLHTYASSKLIGEHFVRDYARFQGLNVVVLRPTIIPGNLAGEVNAINEFCTNILKDQPVVIFGQGSHQREWLSLADLTQAVDHALAFVDRKAQTKADPKACVYEDFIISSGQPISMLDLANTCVRIIGRGSVVTVDKASSQAFSLTSDITKAKTLLGWRPADSVETLIQDVVKKIREK